MSMMPEEDQLAMREELRRNLPQVRTKRTNKKISVSGNGSEHIFFFKKSGKKI